MLDRTNTSLAILGLVRNGGEGLKRTLGLIESLRNRLSHSLCIIVTNDNDDATDEHLASLGSGNMILRLDGLAAAVSNRIERICMARNLSLLMARREDKMPEYTLVLDLDGPNAEVDPDAILALMMAKSQPWEGIFPNQRNAYYDLSALRHPQWCPNDCWMEYKRAERRFAPLRSLGLISRKQHKENLKKKYVYARQYRIPPDHPWIPVQSAFGGLGLYRSAALDRHWYDAGLRHGRPTCEHVGLHRRMIAAGARLFIVPELLNLAPSDHLGIGSGSALPQGLRL